MEKFVRHTGIVCPLDRSNVDTDAIIPKQFLKSIYKTGYGPNLFDGWRYLDKGEPGMDCSKRPLNPDFVLNKPQYRDSTILLARKISAAARPVSMLPGPDSVRFQGGHRAVVCGYLLQQLPEKRLVLVTLDEATIDRLFAGAEGTEGYKLTVILRRRW